MTARHRIYLIPGMFGFANLAGYDYFAHLRAGLRARYTALGRAVSVEVVATPPTSSIRERACILARAVSQSATSDGPIHLVGHSTGGLDARLVLSPTHRLDLRDDELRWTRRVASAVSLNAPHYGTPLASYFTTAAGTRVLYLVSLLTVSSLSVGESSLSVLARVLAGVGSADALLGGDMRMLSRATDLALRFVDDDARRSIHLYLDRIREDQGGIIQITPEAMDLFNAATRDDPNVRYGCVATGAPIPSALRLGRRTRSPMGAMTAVVYTAIYNFASQRHARYGYAELDAELARRLSRSLGEAIGDAANDGVVPTTSMLWDELLWSGSADHLDVLGHFQDDNRPSPHVDWLNSGSEFARTDFDSMLDAIVAFQLRDIVAIPAR